MQSIRSILGGARLRGLMARAHGANVQFSEVLVVGVPARFPLESPLGHRAHSVRLTARGEVTVTAAPGSRLRREGKALLAPLEGGALLIESGTPSAALNDRALDIEYLGKDGKPVLRVAVALTALVVCLDVDWNRDGDVDPDDERKRHWAWGAQGAGAVLLVNDDREVANPSIGVADRRDPVVNGAFDLDDMSPMIVRAPGPPVLPPGCELRLQVTDAASERLRVFSAFSRGARQVLGPGTPQATFFDVREEMKLAVEGLQYPARDFSGLITIDLVLARADEELHRDRIVFRVAPWQMVSSVAKPKAVYVAQEPEDLETEAGRSRNAVILQFQDLADRAKVELKVIPADAYYDGTWLQDQMEIGYAERPGKVRPVVLDSQRPDGAVGYPEVELLGPEFGYVVRQAADYAPNSLDSFGNLDVSPPQKRHPLGRVLFGGALPSATAGRRITSVIREFLYAQGIQDPVELHSDWLMVGHIDEFMAFVPAPATKLGFKLVLASPDACYRLLSALQAKGHGNVLLFEGRKRRDDLDPPGEFTRDAARSVSDLLDDAILARQNAQYQAHIDWNRAVLRQALELGDDDIVYLPALYEEFGAGRALAFFPNMVNMLVLRRHLGIPRPYGPVVDGRCQFEAAARGALEPLGLVCHFIDDWYPYFIREGGVHCGTNVLREPPRVHWWKLTGRGRTDV
jgi:protein-arginine deiminase